MGGGAARIRRRIRHHFFRSVRRHFRHVGRPRGGRGTGRERGADLRYNMEITLQEAYAGKNAQVRIPTSVTCEACSGSGAKAGTKPKTCAMCGGQGRVRHAQGIFHARAHLPELPWPRPVDRQPVRVMRRLRPVTRERTLAVNIPAGVEDGTRIRLAGEGEAGVRGGPAGDLYIFLSIGVASVFSARGRRSALPRSGFDGDGGDGRRIEVPTIDGGKTKVKVPEGTQSGRRFRLQGKGMPVLRARQNGDMYVQVLVETPQKLTKKQRDLLAEFDRLSSTETHPEIRGFSRQGQGVPRRPGRPGRIPLSAPMAFARECFKSGRICQSILSRGCHVAAGPAKI